MASEEREVREIRLDPIVPTESVLVSTVRNQRPRKKEEPAPRDTRAHVKECPFCVGNEQITPPTIAEYQDEDHWTIRIVENLYPVLSESVQGTIFSGGLRQAIDGYGRHEVIIDHNHHGIAIHEMSDVHLGNLFTAYQTRMKELYQSDPRLRYVLVFKNFGPAAGASIPHTHSQMIALPVIPENVQAEVHFSATYYRQHHHCVYCALINDALSFTATIYDSETGESQRKLHVDTYVVEKSEHFIAVKPFASRFEWEMHILPLNHEADFINASQDMLRDFAEVFRKTMARLDAVLGGAQYNYFLHTLPHNFSEQDYQHSYHWHLEICPRTSIPSGFELGSGLHVNTVSPEQAAKQLREVDLND
ncbi:galactose-1-phosphate uridylyltransferase [Kaarinaea lacus]